MGKIKFIAIKNYKNTKSDMYVFMEDGEIAIYPIFDGKEPIKSSYLQLKKLAEQNGINFSSAGLRELRRLNLLYYMGEEEFDRVYKTMDLEKENQAQYQKVKEQSQSDFEEKWFQSFLSTIEKNPSLLFESMENLSFNVKSEKKQLPQKYNPISDYLIPIKEKEINFIVIERSKDRKATMHVFTDDGEEAAYPIFDGKNLVKSSYVQLEKLAKQNGTNFSPVGLNELKDLGLIHYMTEEKFGKVHETISQENKNRAKQHKEKEQLQQKKLEKEQLAAFEKEWLSAFLSTIEKNPRLLLENNRNPYFRMKGIEFPSEYATAGKYLSSSDGNQSNFTISSAVLKNSSKKAAGDDLDSSKVKEFRTRKKQSAKSSLPSNSTTITRNTTTSVDLASDNMDIPEFKYHKDRPTTDNSIEIKPSIKNSTEKTESKLFASDRKITLSKGILNLIKDKKVGVVTSITGAAVVITLATTYAKMDSSNANAKISITQDTKKKEASIEKRNNENDKAKKNSKPTPTNSSDTANVPRYSSIAIKTGGIREYQTIMDALNNADINDKKKVHLSRVYSFLNYFNDSFANQHYSKKDDTKPAHQWDEAIVYYLLFNNIENSTTYKIFDNYLFDTDQSTNHLLKAYKNGVSQDTQAYIISEESLKVDQLINSEKGKAFYKIYKKLFTTYKSLTEDSKYTKEEVINTFSKVIRQHFLTPGKLTDGEEIPAYKFTVLPIINAFYELSSDIDTAEKLSQGELDYINEKMMEKAASKIEEYSNGLIVNRALYGDVCEDALSYKNLRELAIKELKGQNNYNVEKEQRDITNQKAYKKVVTSLNSKKGSDVSDYSSYYRSTEEVKEPLRSLKASNQKALSEKEDKIQHGGIATTEERTIQEKGSSIGGIARGMMEIMATRIHSDKGKSLVKRQSR